MAKKSSKKGSSKRKSTHSSGLMDTAKLAGALTVVGVGITMADRAREGLTLNPFSGDFWA